MSNYDWIDEILPMLHEFIPAEMIITGLRKDAKARVAQLNKSNKEGLK